MPAWHADHFSGLCNVSFNSDSKNDDSSSDLETELRGDSIHSHQRKQKVFHGTDNIVTVPWNGDSERQN